MSYKTKTWKELKELVNSLTEEQLQTPLQIEVAEIGVKKSVHAYVASEDYLVNIFDSEDHGRRSWFDGYGDSFNEDDYKIIQLKGEPVISCDN